MAAVLQTEDIIAFQALLSELSTRISRYQVCFSLYAKVPVTGARESAQWVEAC